MLGIVFAIIAAVCFGFSTAIQKYGLNQLKKFSIRKLIKNRIWLSALVVGAIGIVFYLVSLKTVDLSMAQPILALGLVIPIVIGMTMFKEHISKKELVCIIFVLAGILFVII